MKILLLLLALLTPALQASDVTDKLYALRMNQSMITGEYLITRVPGGWLYRSYSGNGTLTSFATLVPYVDRWGKSRVPEDSPRKGKQ